MIPKGKKAQKPAVRTETALTAGGGVGEEEGGTGFREEKKGPKTAREVWQALRERHQPTPLEDKDLDIATLLATGEQPLAKKALDDAGVPPQELDPQQLRALMQEVFNSMGPFEQAQSKARGHRPAAAEAIYWSRVIEYDEGDPAQRNFRFYSHFPVREEGTLRAEMDRLGLPAFPETVEEGLVINLEEAVRHALSERARNRPVDTPTGQAREEDVYDMVATTMAVRRVQLAQEEGLRVPDELGTVLSASVGRLQAPIPAHPYLQPAELEAEDELAGASGGARDAALKPPEVKGPVDSGGATGQQSAGREKGVLSDLTGELEQPADTGLELQSGEGTERVANPPGLSASKFGLPEVRMGPGVLGPTGGPGPEQDPSVFNIFAGTLVEGAPPTQLSTQGDERGMTEALEGLRATLHPEGLAAEALTSLSGQQGLLQPLQGGAGSTDPPSLPSTFSGMGFSSLLGFDTNTPVEAHLAQAHPTMTGGDQFLNVSGAFPSGGSQSVGLGQTQVRPPPPPGVLHPGGLLGPVLGERDPSSGGSRGRSDFRPAPPDPTGGPHRRYGHRRRPGPRSKGRGLQLGDRGRTGRGKGSRGTCRFGISCLAPKQGAH